MQKAVGRLSNIIDAFASAAQQNDPTWRAASFELGLALLCARWRTLPDSWPDQIEWNRERLLGAVAAAQLAVDIVANELEGPVHSHVEMIHMRADIAALYPHERTVLADGICGVDRVLPSEKSLAFEKNQDTADCPKAGTIDLRRRFKLNSKRFWTDGAIFDGVTRVTSILCLLEEEPKWDAALDARRLGYLLAQRASQLDSLPETDARHGQFAAAKRAWKVFMRNYRRRAWPHLYGCLRFGHLRGNPTRNKWDADQLIPKMRNAARIADCKEPLRSLPLNLLDMRTVIRALDVCTKPPSEATMRQMLAAIWPMSLGEPPKDGAWPEIHKMQTANAYVRRVRRKGDGSFRSIDVPQPDLARVQKLILEVLSPCSPGNGAATAFAPGRSPALHACSHSGAVAAALVDIADFFGSIHPQQVEWVLGEEGPIFAAYGRSRDKTSQTGGSWSKGGCSAIRELCFARAKCGRGWLPQGAPTSPWIANLAGWSLDLFVSREIEKRTAVPGGKWKDLRVRYSRYADDLVISASGKVAEPEQFAAEALELLRSAVAKFQWTVNEAKTRTWVGNGRLPLTLCGIEVPTSCGGAGTLPSTTRRRARAALHHFRVRTTIDNQKERARDRGLLAWAFLATGAPGWLAWIDRTLEKLAMAIAGPVLAEAFLAGWADSVDQTNSAG